MAEGSSSATPAIQPDPPGPSPIPIPSPDIIPPAPGPPPSEEAKSSFDPAKPDQVKTIGGVVQNQAQPEPLVTPGDIARSTTQAEQLTNYNLATALSSGSTTVQALFGTVTTGLAAIEHPADPNWDPFTDPYYKDKQQLWPIIYDAQSRGEADQKVQDYQDQSNAMTKFQSSSNALLRSIGDVAGFLDFWGWGLVPEVEGEGLLTHALRMASISSLSELPVEAIASSTDPLRPNGALISNVVSNFSTMTVFGLIEGTLDKFLHTGEKPSMLDRTQEPPPGPPAPAAPALNPGDHAANIAVQAHAADPMNGSFVQHDVFEKLVQLTKGQEDPSGDPMAISPKKAMGTMQVIESTARDMARKTGDGDLVASMNTEQLRAHLAEIVPGKTYTYSEKYGRQYLQDLLEKYGDPRLAWIAYDAGPQTVEDMLRAYGDPRAGKIPWQDFIDRAPTKETRDYVNTRWGMFVADQDPVVQAALKGEKIPEVKQPDTRTPGEPDTRTPGERAADMVRGVSPDIASLLDRVNEGIRRSNEVLEKYRKAKEALAGVVGRAPKNDPLDHAPTGGELGSMAELGPAEQKTYPMGQVTFTDLDGKVTSTPGKDSLLRIPGEAISIENVQLTDAKGKPFDGSPVDPAKLQLVHDNAVLLDALGQVTTDPAKAKRVLMPSRTLPREHFDFTDKEGRPVSGPDGAAFAHLRRKGKPPRPDETSLLSKFKTLVPVAARLAADNLGEPVSLALEKRPHGNYANADELERRAAGAMPTPNGVAPGALAHLQAQGLFGQSMKGAWGLEKLMWNAVLRAFNSPSLMMRDLMERLTMIPGILNKHLQGVAGRVSVWQKIKLAMGEYNALVRETDEAYTRYRQRVTGSTNPISGATAALGMNSTVMSKKQFFDAVGMAKRYTPDMARFKNIPEEAIQMAREWDKRLYKPWVERADKSEAFIRPLEDELAALHESMATAISLGRMGPAREIRDRMIDVGRGIEKARRKAEGEGHYKPDFLNRIYNQKMLASDKPGFFQILQDHGIPRNQWEEIYDKLVKAQPYTPFGPDNIGRASSLHQRLLADIPDSALERYLEHDISIAGAAYTRQFIPDVLLTEEFGDPNMHQALDQLVLSYHELAALPENAAPAKQARLQQQLQRDLTDLRAVRDQVRGTAGLPENPQAWTSRAIRTIRNWNNATQLTGFVSALPDAMRPAMVYGINRAFGNYLRDLVHFPELAKLSQHEAMVVGHAAELQTALNQGIWGHVSDPFAGSSKVENLIQHIATARFAVDGLAAFEDKVHGWTSTVAGTFMLDAIDRWVAATREGAPAVGMGEVATHEPATVTVHTGTGGGGQAKFAESVIPGAKYWAGDPEIAKAFGKNVTTKEIELRNPTVIDSDKGLYQWMNTASPGSGDELKQLLEGHMKQEAELTYEKFKELSQEEKTRFLAQRKSLPSDAAALIRRAAQAAKESGTDALVIKTGITDKAGVIAHEKRGAINPAEEPLKYFFTHDQVIQLSPGEARERPTISQNDIARLAASYIDLPMAQRIQAQVEQHGMRFGSTRLANFEAWTDQAAKETYAAALSREIDEVIPGSTRPGERPNWMVELPKTVSFRGKTYPLPKWIPKEIGSLMSQYRTYGFSALMRVMIPGAQQFDRKILYGAVGMVGLGLLTDMLLSHARGEDYDNKPWGAKLSNAIDRSGILGSFMDINNALEDLSGGMLGLRPMLGAPTPNNVSRKMAAIGGPSVTTFENLNQAFFGNRDDPRTQSAQLRSIPLANTWYAHELFNRVAGKNGHNDYGPAMWSQAGR